MKQARRVASYQRAIQWIIDNDDVYWLDDPEGVISATACLVADMFGRTDEQVTRDLRQKRVAYLTQN